MSKHDSNATETNFFDYIESFLTEKADKHTSQIGLYSGIVLDLVSEDRLISTLKFFLKTLEDTGIKSGEPVYNEDVASTFQADDNLN